MSSGNVNQRNDIDINLTLHVLFLSRFIQTTCLCRDLSSSGLGCKLMSASLPLYHNKYENWVNKGDFVISLHTPLLLTGTDLKKSVLAGN